ncbi:hypothetical protein [Ovoidimarina sediminis]|uniref:hypothetical protein n=1 Tax=Ovoidimarina sediminis TaxID=3079856 RepID=UPI0029146BE9|nr:hypothetical protein [Rhodophyticola sp. MJ-SS7]MDU8942624.1 hypothetical protein [Rhodophyticola sp. MJ-SS7]
MLPLAVAACGSVDLATMAGLRGISPLDADPAAILVRAELPDGIALLPEGTFLELGAERPGGAVAEGRFALVPDPAVPDGWRIDPGEVAELRALQAEIRGMKAAAPGATVGTLAVRTAPCGAAVAPDDTLSVWLRLMPDAPLRPMLRDVPVADVLEEIGLSALPPCPA